MMFYEPQPYHTLQIPVFPGCEMPLLARKQHAGDFHGKDGLGDVPDPGAPGLELLQKKIAAQAMINIVKENPGKVRQTQGVFTFTKFY